MGKTSCLIHAPSSRLVVVRSDYLKLCEGDMPAAILLALIEHATNFQLELIDRASAENEDRAREGLPSKQVDEWIYRKREEWIRDSMGLLKLHEVKSGMAYLEKREFISRRRHPEFGQLPTRQLKLNIETVNKAMIELFPAVTDNRTSGHGRPQQRSQVAAATVTGSRTYKESTDSMQSNLQIVAATPQPVRASLTRTPCPRCKASVPVMSSNGVPVAPCLTCNIDALAIQAEDVKSDTARVMGFFKHEFERRFGKPPRVTKGKDFGILEGIVRDYGRIDTEGFIRLYMASDDEYVRNAGWSVAFFSTRVNALITATAKTSKQSGCEMCKTRPGYVIVDGAAKRCACNGKPNATSRQEQTTVSA